jgi:hypothetical protein
MPNNLLHPDLLFCSLSSMIVRLIPVKFAKHYFCIGFDAKKQAVGCCEDEIR